MRGFSNLFPDNSDFPFELWRDIYNLGERLSGYVASNPNGRFSPGQIDACKAYLEGQNKMVEIYHELLKEFALPQKLYTGDNDVPGK